MCRRTHILGWVLRSSSRRTLTVGEIEHEVLQGRPYLTGRIHRSSARRCSLRMALSRHHPEQHRGFPRRLHPLRPLEEDHGVRRMVLLILDRRRLHLLVFLLYLYPSVFQRPPCPTELPSCRPHLNPTAAQCYRRVMAVFDYLP